MLYTGIRARGLRLLVMRWREKRVGALGGDNRLVYTESLRVQAHV